MIKRKNKITGSIKGGSFGKKKILYKYLSCKKKSDTYFIIFHGTFGSSFSEKRYLFYADKLVSQNEGSVFLFETSRKLYYHESNLKFEQYGKTFKGKKFIDEISDVSLAVDFFFKTFVKKKKAARLIFVGFSSGGITLSFLIPKYNNFIEKIVLFGSGLSVKDKVGTIRKTYPSRKDILSNFSKFKGNLFIVRGSDDIIFPYRDNRDIFETAYQARLRELIILDGVDHRFIMIKNESRIEELSNLIIDLIANKNLI